MNPIVLEEMAWSFAHIIGTKGICIDEYADAQLSRLLPRAVDRRAVIAVALTKEWVALEDYGQRVYGRDYYILGPRYHAEKRARHEGAHGIGSYPREDWES